MRQLQARTTRKTAGGSAMILVVVVTVLLAAVGVMFVMMSRLHDMSAWAVEQQRDLDVAVDSVVDRIETVLVDDLFGADRTARLADGQGRDALGAAGRPGVNEPFDVSQSSTAAEGDKWIASVEPTLDQRNDFSWYCFWPTLSDVFYDVYDVRHPASFGSLGPFGPLPGLGNSMTMDADFALGRLSSQGFIPEETADADGDGVRDSVWIRIPGLHSVKGRPVYAAVRIVDNCAMLNLNTAWGVWGYHPVMESDHRTVDEMDTAPIVALTDFDTVDDELLGRYLSLVDYAPFMRGDDANPQDYNRDPDITSQLSLRRARMPEVPLDMPDDEFRDLSAPLYQDFHERAVMAIESPAAQYHLFDLSDEIEIRNRFLLSSDVEGRFEQLTVANSTFDAGNNDAGGGVYSVFRRPFTASTYPSWQTLVDARLFGRTRTGLGEFRYDRRHVCTFYSFARNLRVGRYPVLDALEGHTVSNVGLDGANGVDWFTVRDYFMQPHGAAVPTDLRVDWSAIQSDATAVRAQRKQLVRLLYGFRAYFLMQDAADPDNPTEDEINAAARRSAQLVANMIDYVDDTTTATTGPFGNAGYGAQKNSDPTYINGAVIKRLLYDITPSEVYIVAGRFSDMPDLEFGLADDENIYGFERQPFLSEIFIRFTITGVEGFGIELCNPYDSELDVSGWQIKIAEGGAERTYSIPSQTVIGPHNATATGWEPACIVLRWPDNNALVPVQDQSLAYPLSGATIFLFNDAVIELQRPIPGMPTGTPPEDQFMTVDSTYDGPNGNQLTPLRTTQNSPRSSLRGGTAWKYANVEAYVDGSPSLGRPNTVTGGPIAGNDGYQMAVADRGEPAIGTLNDFTRVLWVGNEKKPGDPNSYPITYEVGMASDEGDVRFDIDADSENDPDEALLSYISFLGRPEGALPGRININTATKEVIRAAIPPHALLEAVDPNESGDGRDAFVMADILAENIVTYRKSQPFKHLGELLQVNGWQAFLDYADANPGSDLFADYDLDDPTVAGDFEERDLILSWVANIFTTRSDTFTAYIAVRVGTPYVERDQNNNITALHNEADMRYIAVFDRSRVSKPTDKPRLVALHPVPDAR